MTNDTKTTIVTHSGTFHADDVFAVASVCLFLEKEKGIPKHEIAIERTRDAERIAAADIVVDVGGVYDSKLLRFDHHQEGGAGARENSVPYAAFGLVWKTFGAKICDSKEVAAAVDEKLVQTIDAIDNGVNIFYERERNAYRYLIHDLIFAYRPSWKETERTSDDAFFEVLPICRKIIERECTIARDEKEGEACVLEAYKEAEDKRLIILDNSYPWQQVISSKPDVMFVVMPDDDENGSWKVRAVRSSLHSFENRKDLPESWAGKRGEELVAITGVKDAVFCHNKRFIAVAGSKEGALALAHLALEA